MSIKKIKSPKTKGINVSGEREELLKINEIIDYINDNPIPTSSVLYTEVTVTSAQIKSLGNTPVTIISDTGTGTYIKINKAVIEYTYSTFQYSWVDATDGFLLTGGYTSGYYIPSFWIDSITENLIAIFDGNGHRADLTTYAPAGLGGILAGVNTLKLTTVNESTSPTLGSGTFLVKVWYEVETFGSNL